MRPQKFLSALIVAMCLAISSTSSGSEALVPSPASSAPTFDAGARQAGANEGWWQEVSASLARQEYSASQTPEGLQAPNRAQNLRTRFGETGIEIIPRTDDRSAPAWRFTWSTTRLGRQESIQEVGSTAPRPEGSRVVYERTELVEWYENSEKGLEQAFTLAQRPEGVGPLRLEGEIGGGLRPELNEGAVDLMTDEGACALRYGKLRVWDANQVEVPSRIAVIGQAMWDPLESTCRHASLSIL